MPHFERAAACINSFEGIAFVVCINTVGNALVVDFEAEQPLIHPKGGFGGIGGGLVKYTALANVKKMRELLRPDIDVVGVGGVRTACGSRGRAIVLVVSRRTCRSFGFPAAVQAPASRGVRSKLGFESHCTWRADVAPA